MMDVAQGVTDFRGNDRNVVEFLGLSPRRKPGPHTIGSKLPQHLLTLDLQFDREFADRAKTDDLGLDRRTTTEALLQRGS